MKKRKWHFIVANLSRDYTSYCGVGFVILAAHWYKEEIGIVLFNILIGIEKY